MSMYICVSTISNDDDLMIIYIVHVCMIYTMAFKVFLVTIVPHDTVMILNII